MKKLTTFLAAFILLFSLFTKANAQTGSISLNVFSDLSTVDLAAFALTNGLSGAPRILQVIIQPEGQEVYVEGVIKWKKDEKSSFEEIFSFITNNFVSKTFYNDEIGSGEITLKSSSSNSSLTEENLKRNKPTGSYTISLSLFSASGVPMGSTQQQLDFLNPAQTLTILSPQEGSSQDAGSVLIIWDGVQGASSYEVRANYRETPSTSLEEALNSGNPVIDDRNVGNVLNVNARQILSRELIAGKEVVVQVTAIIDGPGGGTRLSSNIVSFFLVGSGADGGPNVDFNTGGSANASASLNEAKVDGDMTTLATLLAGSVDNKLVADLLSGKIKPDQLEISAGDGTTIQYSDFKNILTYLQANRNAINKITFTQK